MMKLSVVTIMLIVSCSEQAVSEKQVKAEVDLNEKLFNLKKDENPEEQRNEHTEKVDELQAVWDQIEKIHNKNLRLVNDVAELKKENLKLQKMVGDTAEIKRENTYLKQSYMKLVDEVAEMKKNIANNQSNVNEENFVSFTAYATEDKTYNEGDVVEFKGIINNYGNHYDNAAFTFTCPVTGYYMMSAAFRVPEGDNYMQAAIVMDNTSLIGIIAQDNTEYNQASNLVVSLCNANQQIWVECSYGENNRALGGDATTFTVTLLKIA